MENFSSWSFRVGCRIEIYLVGVLLDHQSISYSTFGSPSLLAVMCTQRLSAKTVQKKPTWTNFHCCLCALWGKGTKAGKYIVQIRENEVKKSRNPRKLSDSLILTNKKFHVFFWYTSSSLEFFNFW